MLPPGDHERACRVFCRILRRLEERDRRNGKNIHSSLREGTGAADNHSIFGAEATNRSICTGVPASLDTGAEEERQRRDAAR
jgi:hypothetical protein